MAGLTVLHLCVYVSVWVGVSGGWGWVGVSVGRRGMGVGVPMHSAIHGVGELTCTCAKSSIY